VLQGSVGKGIRTRCVGRLEDAVKSSGRFEDKLKTQHGERTVDICGTSEYKNRGTFSSGLSAVRKRLAIKTTASYQIDLRSVSVYHQNNSAAKSFRQQTLHQTKPLKIEEPYHKEAYVLQLATTAFTSEKVCHQSHDGLNKILTESTAGEQFTYPSFRWQRPNSTAQPRCASTSVSIFSVATIAGAQCGNSVHVNTEPASRAAASNYHMMTTSTRSTKGAMFARPSKLKNGSTIKNSRA
jgi:hypothetical protein